MHRVSGFLLLSVMTLAGVVLTVTPSRGQGVGPNVVRWDTIIGSTATGVGVSNFEPFGNPTISTRFPLVAQGGHAWVHLQTGQAKFSVKGLVLANSTPLAVAGTTGIISEVKGTLVCNGISNQASAFIDTAAVPFDPKGNAEFVGTIEIPTACLGTPQTMVFLIRVASVSNPNGQGAVGQWIAVGGIRTP